MGCAASVSPPTPPTPITEDQVREMCQDCCRRMEIICVTAALANPNSFTIEPPNEVKDLKESADSLRQAAKDVKAPDAEKKEGMFESVKGAVTGAAGKAAAVGLNGLAQGLEGLTNQLTKPWETVASDVVTKEQDELRNVFFGVINGIQFDFPHTICRGQAPWNKESYEAVAADTISNTLMGLAKDDLQAKLLPVVQAGLENHLVLTGWTAAITKFNTAHAAALNVFREDFLVKAGVKKIEFDVAKHICQEIQKQMHEKMCQAEKETRASPQNKDITEPRKPVSFAMVFSAEPLYQTTYDVWKHEHDQPATQDDKIPE